MRECERCGGEVSWTNDTVILIAHMPAHLCTSCGRDHTVLVNASEEWRERTLLDARVAHYQSLAQARRPVSLEEWECLYAGLRMNDRAFTELTAEFLLTKPAEVEGR